MSGKYKKVKLSNTGTVHASRVAAPQIAVESDDDSDNFQIATTKTRQGKAAVLDDDSDDAAEQPAPVPKRGASSSKRAKREEARSVDDEVIITA